MPGVPEMTTALQRCLPETAFVWIDQWPPLTANESVELAASPGRLLAHPVLGGLDEPPHPRTARDGFAVCAAETEGASDYNPLPLGLAREGRVGPGIAVAVRSGEPLPVGADAVLPLELADAAGKLLDVAGSVAPGEGVIQPGEEYRAGEELLAAGRWLRAQDIAWLALAGINRVTVRRRPRVRVVLTGEYPREVNGKLLGALVGRDGGELCGLDVVPTAQMLETVLAWPAADLVLVVGGSGLGDNDYAARVLAEAGELVYHGVAIHPGDSAGLGRLGATPVVLLPGSPLACLCAYDLLGSRLSRRLAGWQRPWPYRGETLPLARKIASQLGRLDICRVRVVNGKAEPVAVSEGRLLRTVARADGVVLVPVQSEGYAAGSEVTVYRFDDYSPCAP